MSRTPVPFAPDTLESIRRAFRIASDRRHDLVSLEHMLHALTEDPQAQSILMDQDTLERFRHLCTAGNAPGPELLPHLTEAERAAYIRCRGENLRLEQERLPNSEVLAALVLLDQCATEIDSILPATGSEQPDPSSTRFERG